MSGYIFDAVYLPTDSISGRSMREIKKRFHKRIFNEKVCQMCPHLDDRFSYMCRPCNAYLDRPRLFKRITIKGVPHIGLPRGAMQSEDVRRDLGLTFDPSKMRDARISGKTLPEGLQVTSALWYHQKEAITKLLGAYKFNKEKCVFVPTENVAYEGTIKAPPRTGKTLIVLSLAVAFNERTLILAHQKDLLLQFIEDIESHTNFKDVASFNGKPVYGICKTVQDFSRYPIALATYQQFITEGGMKKLDKIKRKFGAVFVDEGHRAAATMYSKTLASIPAKHRLTVTGTPKRKDLLHYIVEEVIGPVKSSVQAEVLVPKVIVHKTGQQPKRPYRTWVPAMQWLAKNEERNTMIAKQAVRDVQRGHSVVIPVAYVHHTKTLAEMINLLYGEEIAVPFHGKSDRESIIAGARSGRYRVVVGIRSLISTGINVPRWSCLYTIHPISNPPNYEQETRRVCTKMEGKKQPIIRIFVDEMNMSKACFKTCFYRTFMALKFRITEKSFQKAKALIDSLDAQRREPEGVQGVSLVVTRTNHGRNVKTLF